MERERKSDIFFQRELQSCVAAFNFLMVSSEKSVESCPLPSASAEEGRPKNRRTSNVKHRAEEPNPNVAVFPIGFLVLRSFIHDSNVFIKRTWINLWMWSLTVYGWVERMALHGAAK